MDGKDLLRGFKAADWKDAREVECFVAEALKIITREDVDRLLSLLGSRGLPGDARAQRSRCYVFGKLAEKVLEKSLFVPFVRAMKSDDGNVAATLAALLPRVNHIEGHGELCTLMKSQDQMLRKTVAGVLKQIGGTTVFETLSQYCTSPDFVGRMEAMEVVVSIGRGHAVPALTAILLLGNHVEKIQALAHLGNIEYMAKDIPGALRAIATVLNDPSEKVVMTAVSAFGALASEDDFFQHVGPLLDSSHLTMVKAAIEGLRRFRSQRVIDALDQRLRLGPNAIRMVVLASLESIGNDAVIPAVVAALNFKKIDVRTRAGEVLTNLALAGKIDIARTIIWLLRSKDVNLRRMAVDIAKKVGDPTGELAPKLLKFLRDEDWWVRERVMDALVEMAGQRLTKHLVMYLQDPSDVVRRYAVDALERVKDPASLGALVRTAQNDSDWWVRERAIETIGVINDERAVPYIIDLLAQAPDLRTVCVCALRVMKARGAAPHVAALLAIEEADAESKLVILECLKELDDPAQGDAVTALAEDPDHRVRNLVRELTQRWRVAASPKLAAAAAKASTLLERLLLALAQAEGDDLILASAHRPYMKKIGKVLPLANHVFTAEQVQALLLPHLNPKQRDDLARLKDVDFSFELKAEGLRFRCNVFQQLPGLSAVFRIVKDRVPLLEELGLPPVVKSFAELKNGLVLVGGPTGSGKSTTLAGIIDHINRTSARHIITLEDPIEVLHKPKQCLINQREIGTHTASFESALRATVREDPDVILVGEMRDLDTIKFALTASETGHLVLGTLHTVSADTSIDRLINVFPSGQQPQVRGLLADTLRAVMCQFLLKRKHGPGRAIAVEILINNEAVANLIRKGKTFQIPSVIATQRELGMQSMDSDLERLFKQGIISGDDAYMKAANKKNFEVILGITGAPEVKSTMAESRPLAAAPMTTAPQKQAAP